MTDLKIDFEDERVWREGQIVPVTNKAFQLLRLFVHHPDRLLTKDRILDEIWPDTYVSESLIKEYVHDLRQALGDDPSHPNFIETVRGRGYRYLGGIEIVNPQANVVQLGDPPSEPPRISVRPIENLTGNDRWALFCRGLRDDLLTDLARYPDIQVIEDGDEKAADYDLAAAVQATDETLRINIRMSDRRERRHLFAQQYDRPIADLFEIQSDIVSRVAAAAVGLGGQIRHAERQRLARRPPQDLRAYELYLVGQELELQCDRDSVLRAYDMLRQSTALDPDYARAWLILGWLCWQLVLEDWSDDPQTTRSLQRQAFITAARLDPLDPFAIMEMSAVHATEGDEVAARDCLERALDLGQNQADLLIAASTYLVNQQDDTRRALRVFEDNLNKVVRVSSWHHLTGCRVCFFAGEFERALSHARSSAENLITRVFTLLCLARMGRQGELENARVAFKNDYPGFESDRFVDQLPITAPVAREEFLAAADEAGISKDRPRKRATT